MSDELLPCPFCGGEAKVYVGQPMYDGEQGDCYCYCDECSLQLPSSESPNLAYEEAVAAWNRRTVPTPQAAPDDIRNAIEDALGDAYGHEMGMAKVYIKGSPGYTEHIENAKWYQDARTWLDGLAKE